MSIIRRLGNLAKGTLSTATSAAESELERLARERALAEDLANPTPSAAAHAELDRRKAGAAAASAGQASAPAAPTTAGLDGELARLERAFQDGVLTRAELDRKKAEAVARSRAEADDASGDAAGPAIRRTL